MIIILMIIGFLFLIGIFYIFKLSRKISEIDKRGNNSGENVTSSDSLNDFEDRILNNLAKVNQNIIDLNSQINVLNNGYSTLQNRVDNYSDPNFTDGSIYDTFRSVNAEELGYEVDNYGNIVFNKPVTFNNPVRINDRSADALRVDGEISVGPDDNFRACIKIDNAKPGMPRSIVFGRFGVAFHGYTINDDNNNTGTLNIIASGNAVKINTLTYDNNRYYLHNYIWIKDDIVKIKRKLEILNESFFNKPVRIYDRSANALRVDGEISVGADDNFRASIKIDKASQGMASAIVFGRFGYRYHGYTINKSTTNPGVLNLNAQDTSINMNTQTYMNGIYQLHNYIWIKDERVEIKRRLEILGANNKIVGVWHYDGLIDAQDVKKHYWK